VTAKQMIGYIKIKVHGCSQKSSEAQKNEIIPVVKQVIRSEQPGKII